VVNNIRSGGINPPLKALFKTDWVSFSALDFVSSIFSCFYVDKTKGIRFIALRLKKLETNYIG